VTQEEANQQAAVRERARSVADAVLYEGYLLYPYRASSGKNQSRWQFGVLGPREAAGTGLGEEDSLSAQFPVQAATELRLTLRFLQLQHRRAERDIGDGTFCSVDQLVTPSGSWVTWDEAAEVEVSFEPLCFADADQPWILPIHVADSTDIEYLDGGRLVRERAELTGTLEVRVTAQGALDRVGVTVRNTGAPPCDKQDAISRSMIGTHLIADLADGPGTFVSLLEPPATAQRVVAGCRQHRCFPVLAGEDCGPGASDLLLISPIILYDHPEIAEQSKGALCDSTEIDEILTLRVMTMTDEEKAQARATDLLAARIIDQCDAMTAEAMLDLHGVLRDPHAGEPGLIPEIPDDVQWWDPQADNAVHPELDAVLVNGVRVAAGSRVRLHPSRRADAQDMFVSGKTARVTAVHEDVDGGRHVAVVVEDDPAADLHDWYGRYLYFSPDEIEPLAERSPT
jgi:hypothetical protein